ncbi:SDR family oxidoreductase [Verminephrobacter aporrectodeae subsp. tuberculatae]|uniref:SDR family NAD(P)-dependent oxidoreductase n=1 Tax=Verminephrobacter aporrectodeae TaxID=1110389 RepID=UPI00223791BB|nr:SDR family NAD(P)-dependent oxidoreductase [Verminephrobacter aporrectodeae]MCW5255816.1 SDR family oxidoreductase [Verminephrobacter aporrectodeae subsp. tuberculatae]
MLLKGKSLIVTGGSRGIGRAIAVQAARHGADVLIAYRHESDAGYQRGDAAREVLAEIRTLGRRALALEGNVADPDYASALVEYAVQSFGRVDALASNAGVCPFHSFLDLPPQLLRDTVDINLNGAFFVTQVVARQMQRQGQGGAIVATSSISALVGDAMQTHYTPTKAGVHSLMQSCAIALGPYGIRCNSVLPGAIATDLNRQHLSDADQRSHLEKRIPLGRLGQPDDVGDCVVFLASDMARYVTGAALLVDGGMFVNLQ